VSGPLLDVGPLIAEADGAMEQHRLVRVGGEVAEALELDHVTGTHVGEYRLDLGSGEHLTGVRIEVVECVAGRLAGHLGAEQALVQRHRGIDRVSS